MRKRLLVYLTIIAIFHSAQALAQYGSDQQKSDEAVPEGMEMRKMNDGVFILMPKGERFHRPNQATYVEESQGEYSARKFMDMDNRLKKLEETNRELVEEIKYLESKLVLQEKGADKDAPKPTEE